MIYLGGMIGTAIVGFTVDRYGSGRVLFGAGMFIAVALIGLILTHLPLVFLAFFLLNQIASIVEGYTVPLAHYFIVPSTVIDAFSGARRMILYGTNAVTTPTAG